MIHLLASLEKLVFQLRQKKHDATKLRKKVEKQLKDTRSIERRSFSGLNSVDKKIEFEREDISDVSTVLTQKTSQLESLQRLISAAQERLINEKELVEQIEQEIEFSENPEEKQSTEDRLRSILNHIKELNFEIKNREKTVKKISNDIAAYSNVKTNIATKIQKQSKSKPTLRETMKSSHDAAEKFVKELERRTNAEESAKKALEKVSSKFKELLIKKRKAAKKKLARKSAAKKKPARKSAAKKKPARK